MIFSGFLPALVLWNLKMNYIYLKLRDQMRSSIKKEEKKAKYVVLIHHFKIEETGQS